VLDKSSHVLVPNEAQGSAEAHLLFGLREARSKGEDVFVFAFRGFVGLYTIDRSTCWAPTWSVHGPVNSKNLSDIRKQATPT
jgi:hypothetical protein